MRTTMIAIAIAALAATPAGAQSRQQVEAMRTPALNQCLNANETTDGMSGCLSAEAKRQDAALNATY